MPYVADEFTGRTFGKYEVLSRLAVGGMAEIFLGFTRQGPFANRPVVLKRILTEQREDPKSLQMLIDEAKLTATLSHPHIAQVLDLEVDGDEVLLVIEFIRGANLEELVSVVADRKEQVPLGFVLAAMRDAAQGLHHAHAHIDGRGQPQPIMHRDITPRNLMVDFDGIGKVLDFGIAKAAGASRRTVAGMVRGTSAYMSPEQAVDGRIDTRSDLFSLGIIFHELLVGQRLFSRGNAAKEMAAVYEAEIPVPSVANRRVPKALDAVVLRALERSVTRRYQSALELMRDLALAAGSTTWPTERCAELVRDRFAERQSQIKVLLERVGSESGYGLSTVPARPDFSSSSSEYEVRTVIDLNPKALLGSTTDRTPVAAVAAGAGGPVPRRSPSAATTISGDDASAAPTRFFTPNFEASRPTQPGAITSGDDQKAPASARAQRQGSSRSQEPSTTPAGRGAPSRGRSRAPLVLWALVAMMLGAGAGVLVYRALSGAPAASIGIGRLTLSSDRPVEVQLGEQPLGRTPLVDLYLPAGHHAFKLKEADGAWKRLEVDVKKDQVNRLDVKLDTLPPLP